MLHPLELMMMSRGTNAGRREMLVIALCQGGVGDRPAASLVKYADELVESLDAMVKHEAEVVKKEREDQAKRKACVDKAMADSEALKSAQVICDMAAKNRTQFDKERHEQHMDLRLQTEKLKKGKARNKVVKQAQDYWKESTDTLAQLQAACDKAARERDEIKKQEYKRLSEQFGYKGEPSRYDD